MSSIMIFMSVLIGAVYLIGFAVSISDTTTTDTKYHAPKTDSFFDTGWVDTTRCDARTSDVWYATWWPLRLIWVMFWGIVGSIHCLTQYPLLLIGFSYKKTIMYKAIDDFCWARNGL